MTITLNDTIKGLIDGKNYATIATINPDGAPQTSVVWIKRDGDDLLFSTLRDRRKERNLRRDPRVSVSVYAHDNPYSHVEIAGTVTTTEEGGRELADELSQKYTGQDFHPEPADAVRLVVRVTPTKIAGNAA